MKLLLKLYNRRRGALFGILALVIVAILFSFAYKMLITKARAEEKELCFYTGEWSVGTETVCYYRCDGGDKRITVNKGASCPDEENIQEYPYSED